VLIFFIILQCQSRQQLQNCLKRAEIIVFLAAFNYVLCHVRAYTVIVYYRRITFIRYHKALLGL